MKTYEIYQMGKLPPLTVVEAYNWEFFNEMGRLAFYACIDGKKRCVAVFNWNNIAGFSEVINDEQN